jgi:tetratricopeptide (TPR) repeat protein
MAPKNTPVSGAKKPPAKTSTATATKPKPKPAATPVKRPDDKAEWDRVTAIGERTDRIAALEKFIASFPKSTHLTDAKGLIAAARVETGNDDLAIGNIDAAVAEYQAATAIVPTPVVQGFWDAGLVKVPTNLYFRNRREDGLAIAKLLEEKAGANSGQLLSLAQFYLTIEDGASAKHIADGVIASEPTSAAAYRTLGLAERMQFRLDGSAAAFARQIELDPESIDGKIGLAEMKRALGKPDEALALYESVLAKDPDNVTAGTGHVLALFDAGRRSDAEAEMAKLLDDKPGNFLVLGEAAYWYAANRDGAKAVELAQKAIAIEPRFVWSHIALARGLLLQGHPSDAEKILIAARRYGNFPTLEYELAATRFAAGFYREAAEGLATTFTTKDGRISTALGGRVPRDSESLTELLADERRSSIFAPTAADDPGTSERIAALLELQQTLNAERPDDRSLTDAADAFAKGDDAMAVHRELYAASVLLERKVALQKAVELANDAVKNVDSGLTAAAVSSAVMASELYAPRADAAIRGEYVIVPEVPRATLSSILRGRIEDIIGWASYQAGSDDEAVVRLRRAVSVLPPDSAWWRTSTWHLGAALAATGKDREALAFYVLSYKGSQPDAIRYSVIEALYRRVNGSDDGLADKIGQDPAEAARVPVPSIQPTPVLSATPTPIPTPDMVSAIPIATPLPTPQPSPTAEIVSTPVSTPAPTVDASSSPTAVPSPTATPELTPTPAATPAATPIPKAQPTPPPAASSEPSSAVTAEATPTPVTLTNISPTSKTTLMPDANTHAKTRDLFPPVVITIPSKTDNAPAQRSEETSRARDIPPCEITSSSDTLRLNRSGGSQAVVIGRVDDGPIDGMEIAGVPEVVIRRETVSGVTSRGLFVIRAVTAKAGLYQVKFKLPCGSKTIEVSVH